LALDMHLKSFTGDPHPRFGGTILLSRTPREEEYFRKRDVELIERMISAAKLENERRQFADAAGISDQDILDDLERLGYSRETVMLVHLVPMVHVAWIDGSVSHPEREALFAMALLRGVKAGIPAHVQLSKWLNTRPSKEFFLKTQRAIRVLLQSHPPETRSAEAADLVRCCTNIASASASLFGFGPRICSAERQLITEICADIEWDRKTAAERLVANIRWMP